MAILGNVTRIKSGLTGQEYSVGLGFQENVTVLVSAPITIDWTQYGVAVTVGGETTNVPLNSAGTCTFLVPFGTQYSIQLPAVGVYIQPSAYTYTASQQSRIIQYNYVLNGVFGVDANGKYYTIAECQALEDKSIIVAGAFTNSVLENATRKDGKRGCGFIWNIDNSQSVLSSKQWASANTEFSQTLLPFVSNDGAALNQCDGFGNTSSMISEVERLNITTTSASGCRAKALTIGGVTKYGFLPAYGQLRRLAINISSMQALYTALGKTAPTITSGNWWSSCQSGAASGVYLGTGGFYTSLKNNNGLSVLVCFDL